MIRFARWSACVVVASLVLAAGCSGTRPKSGTLVTFDLPQGRQVKRERLAALSRYLIMKSAAVLDVEKARVESVDSNSLVLLLPDKNVSRAEANKLLTGTGLEFYHLKNVSSKAHPDRPWKMRAPTRSDGSYILTGPGGLRLDNRRDPKLVLSKVVGAPFEKPILTGMDIEPSASSRESGTTWAVLVRFTRRGAKVFHDFTRANRGEYLAVFYHGEMLSAPIVEEPISGGEAYITGFRTRGDAEMAVSRLNSGVLPEQVRIRSVRRLSEAESRS
jgi:preprotein translocase subunit SecD